MQHRKYSGRIDYIDFKRGCLGQEWFTVTVQPDGARTLRAFCEVAKSDLVRDVTLSLDGQWLPTDCFVRLVKGGKFLGSGWFRFTDRGIECESYTPDAGRVSQVIDTGQRVRIFACHPLMTDGWQTRQFDHGRPEKTQIVRPWAHPSPLPDGSTGPMAGIGQKTIEYVGEEEIEVPAGRFRCRRYNLHVSNPANPPMITWVHGEDSQLIKMHWALREFDYVLAAYDR
ncbi:MAG: hypothetical protein FJX65_14445 [Alphaproteobacteria bacterium]|nr:hypothetical protein [Alphaproteobacteria bacterium]